MKKENVYFNVGAYKETDRENFRSDLVALTLENAKAPLEERITPYEMKFDKDGNPNFRLRWETEIDRKENEALFKIRDLMLKGSSYALWISPANGEENYRECRFVAVINKGVKDGELLTECRAFCGNFDGNGCLEISKKLGKDIDEVEDLRSSPIEFEVKDGKNWIDVLEEIIEMPKVWETIRKGEDIINKNKKEKVVEEVMKEFMPRIKGGMNHKEELKLGSQIEYALMRRGVELQSVGSCGMSNTEALKLEGSFNVLFQSSLVPGIKPEGYKYFCSVCGCWCKENICPLCKMKLH
jgi:hypothetical protein